MEREHTFQVCRCFDTPCGLFDTGENRYESGECPNFAAGLPEPIRNICGAYMRHIRDIYGLTLLKGELGKKEERDGSGRGEGRAGDG